MAIKGQCLCGTSKFASDGEIKFAIKCFCRDCQHVSGGGHLPQLGVAAQGFASTGPIKTYHQLSDAGSDLGFSFCADCGSPLFKTTSKATDLVFIMAGAVDEPHDFDVGQDVFEASRQAWDHA